MTERTADQLIENVVTLPTIPTILAKLNSVIEDPEASAGKIAEVVSTDQSVSTKVLRIANSTFYGLRTKVSSVTQSVSILGTRVIRNLVLQATTIQAYKHLHGHPEFNIDDFWKHSILVGIASQNFAKASNKLKGKPDEYYAAGLIHDIGKVILMDCKTEEFLMSVRNRAGGEESSAEAESKIFGFDHTHVGEHLARRWKLPEDLAAGIRYHHTAPSEVDPAHLVGYLVGIADQFAHNFQEKKDESAAVGLNPVALDLLGISIEDSYKVSEEVVALASGIEV